MRYLNFVGDRRGGAEAEQVGEGLNHVGRDALEDATFDQAGDLIGNRPNDDFISPGLGDDFGSRANAPDYPEA